MVVKFSLDDGVVQLLDEIAKDEDRTRSQMISRMIKQWRTLNERAVAPAAPVVTESMAKAPVAPERKDKTKVKPKTTPGVWHFEWDWSVAYDKEEELWHVFKEMLTSPNGPDFPRQHSSVEHYVYANRYTHEWGHPQRKPVPEYLIVDDEHLDDINNGRVPPSARRDALTNLRQFETKEEVLAFLTDNIKDVHVVCHSADWTPPAQNHD